MCVCTDEKLIMIHRSSLTKYFYFLNDWPLTNLFGFAYKLAPINSWLNHLLVCFSNALQYDVMFVPLLSSKLKPKALSRYYLRILICASGYHLKYFVNLPLG